MCDLAEIKAKLHADKQQRATHARELERLASKLNDKDTKGGGGGGGGSGTT